MGTDCSLVFEVDSGECGVYEWDAAFFARSPKNSDFFRRLQNHGYCGYPDNVSSESKRYLEENECWGEGWMSMADFLKAAKKHQMDAFFNVFKKKMIPKMRVIYRFDN